MSFSNWNYQLYTIAKIGWNKKPIIRKRFEILHRMLSFFVCFQSKIDKPLDLHILNAVALISLQNKIKYFGTKKLSSNHNLWCHIIRKSVFKKTLRATCKFIIMKLILSKNWNLSWLIEKGTKAAKRFECNIAWSN